MQAPRKITNANFRITLLMLTGMMVLLCSCQDDEICEEVTANDLRIGFYMDGDDDDSWMVVDSLRVYTLERPGQPVHEHLVSVSVLELPLNPAADSCSFVIDFYHLADTIRIVYTRETHLISVECGFTMFFDIKETSHSTNHIVQLHQPVSYVTNTLDEHIKVFLPDTIAGDQ